MKIILTCFIACLALCSQAQPVDFGKVKADPDFDCSKDFWLDSVMFGVPNICNSKNQLEIRLSTYSLPGGGGTLIILTNADTVWDIKKYTAKRGSTIGVEHDIATFSLNPNVPKYIHDYEFNAVFNSLKQNDIFLLPDQSELVFDRFVHDGGRCVLTFKVNNSFRTYSFSNPKSYADAYPNIKELKEYEMVYECLTSFFN